ncbi:hypothetical protein VP01_3517g2 [Puccinia sorghi]|uniref:Uncharacterized protein n=1 Tax=Puccinia sorghi TaxID=27349 RepID=A0A0L6UWE5_9BASI|nr:hypothetical protein VP01_3517g2 [Puccinia sorghi]
MEKIYFQENRTVAFSPQPLISNPKFHMMYAPYQKNSILIHSWSAMYAVSNASQCIQSRQLHLNAVISPQKTRLCVESIFLDLEKWLQWFLCLPEVEAGITPAPNQPNMTTISNIHQPIVDDLVHMNNGLTIVTPQYPRGRMVIVRLAALLGDVVATHKVAGFMSHLAKFFFSWCTVWKANMDEMMIRQLRTKRKTLALSHQWKDDEMV